MVSAEAWCSAIVSRPGINRFETNAAISSTAPANNNAGRNPCMNALSNALLTAAA